MILSIGVGQLDLWSGVLNSLIIILNADNFLELGAKKVKTKRSYNSAQGKEENFLQNPRGMREQIRVIFTKICNKDKLGPISFEDSGFCTGTSLT